MKRQNCQVMNHNYIGANMNNYALVIITPLYSSAANAYNLQ